MAASKIKKNYQSQDLIICVQGDEPMMRPEMINNVIKPFFKKKGVMGTVLAMDIISKESIFATKT